MRRCAWEDSPSVHHTFCRDEENRWDCQVPFNDPEEDECSEQLFVSEWCCLHDEESNLALVELGGPACASASAYHEAEGSEEAEDDEDTSRELPEGMWMMDTGSGHDLITPQSDSRYQPTKERRSSLARRMERSQPDRLCLSKAGHYMGQPLSTTCRKHPVCSL